MRAACTVYPVKHTAGDLLSIGKFARRSRLTIKALRIYDDVGLVRPTVVDPVTGYRRYLPTQLHQARLIGLLRGAEMGLADITLLLEDLERNAELAVGRLDAHLDDLEAQHVSRRTLVRHVRTILHREDPPMNDVHVRYVSTFAALPAGLEPATQV